MKILSISLVQKGTFWAIVLFCAACFAASIVLQQWAIAALVPAVALVILWPVEVSLGLFAFLVPFDSIATIGEAGGPTITRAVGAGAALILLAAGFGQRRFRRPPKAALWWGLFISWGALTTLWAVNPEKALDRLPTAASLFFLYLLAVSVRMSEREVSRVVTMAIAGAVGASLLSLGSSLSGMVAGRNTLASGSLEADPNFLASALLLPFCLAAGEIMSETRSAPRKMLMLAAAAVIGLGILATMSRGALLAMAVMAVVYFWQSDKKWKVLLPAIALGGSLLMMPDTFFSRIGGAVSDRGAGRLDIWIAGLATLKHFFLFGAGINSFPDAYQLFSGEAPVFRGYARASHNIYLGTSVELGILGFLFLFLAFRSQLNAGRSGSVEVDRARVLPYRAACWGILAAGMFVDLIWSKQFWLSWMLLALAVRAAERVGIEPAPSISPETHPLTRHLEPVPYWKLQGMR